MTRLVSTVLFALALPALSQQPAPTVTPRPTPHQNAPSLADVVRRSQQRAHPDEKKKKSLGVISNETLKSHEGKKPLSVVNGKVSAPQPSPSQPAEVVLRDNEGHTEQEWRSRAASLRRGVLETRERVEHLEAEAKRLENDFYAWSDGNYRDNVIKPSWDRAKEDLKKARADMDQAETALSNLEEEARKAGAPPGWIR